MLDAALETGMALVMGIIFLAMVLSGWLTNPDQDKIDESRKKDQ